MITSITDCTVLNNGVNMPWFGLGVFKSQEGEEVENAVKWALELGYRAIDTATVYGNERGVGKAMQASGIPREQIFLTTKLWNEDQRQKRPFEAFNESLERLGTDYVDLYLIHWPVAGCYKDSWKALEEIYASGRAKAVGVSNFMINHLEDLLGDTDLVPTVNQVEFHPHLVQPDLLKFCKDHKIQLEAWSPLMKGEIVSVKEAQQLAEKYHKTPAQIVLRWDLEHEVVTIPKSVHRERIEENKQIFDFELTDEEVALLDSLDMGRRLGPDPNNFSF
ncbi:aldo/keto reductase [candidate division KSB3 bacterium]|uniref:Aldo/keto reductase n=1 Tax=candidate division KSB3 bacterium TaxID=2044937 RepID=A0A9D5JVZ2_9BACT|nr:aldo/keto reductase [candidate division KSB3 bacterium]MBD3325292.1 aldo/keto reductase [candidate division KSB3 bacterium]